MNKNIPLVSVIIFNYNGKCFMDKCQTSLCVRSYPKMEIILVDNGSSDGSIDLVKKEMSLKKRSKNSLKHGLLPTQSKKANLNNT